MQKPLTFFFLQTLQRHTCPYRHHFCHFFSSDYLCLIFMVVFPFFFGFFPLSAKRILGPFDFRRLFKFFCLDGSFFFFFHFRQFFFHFRHIIRCAECFQTQTGSGFVNEVNGFIRQETVRYISGRQLHSRFDGIIGNGYFMVHFVFITQSFQHRYCRLFVRFFHFHRLETAFKSSVFFNMFPVFFQCGGTNELDFSTRKSGFQNIGCVNGAFRSPCTDDGMDFIHKQNDIAISFYFVHGFFHTFFKFPTIFGTSNHGRKIQTHNSLIF